MTTSPVIHHVLDDLSMGGVVRALGNFFDPRLAEFGTHEATIVGTPNKRQAWAPASRSCT